MNSDSALTHQNQLPLAGHRLFDSHDLDETRDFVGRIFCPHRLTTLRPGIQLDARHHSVPLYRDVSLNYVQYGASVGIEPGYLRDFYLLQIPLRGGASIRCGTQRVESHAGLASFPSPTEALSMRWHEDSPHLIVKLDNRALHARLEALMQSPMDKPLVFDLGVDMDAPAVSAVVGFISYLRSAVDGHASFLEHKLLAEQAESHLVSSILLSIRHNYSHRLEAGSAAQRTHSMVLPRSVKRAQEFMGSRAELPITLADVCSHVGISARSLQQTFQQYTGASPMAFLRDLRLDRVHAELLASKPDTSAERRPLVYEVAARYGFFHLGHFSSRYRERFSEMPSETRQRGRQRLP
jgi:AraC-like DNA-binding protein